MKPLPSALALFSAFALIAGFSPAYAQSVTVKRQIRYTQNGTASFAQSPTPYELRIDLRGGGLDMTAWGPAFYKPGTSQTPATGPSDATNTGTLNFSLAPNNGNDYIFVHSFASDSAMLSTYPTSPDGGQYGINFVGSDPPTPASFTAGLVYAGGTYPTVVPQVVSANNGAVWSSGGLLVSPTGTTTLTLNALPEYTTATYGALISAGLYSDSGVVPSSFAGSYRAPSLAVDQTAVTQVQISGADLTPGVDYILEIQYGIFSGGPEHGPLDASSFVGSAGYYRVTRLTVAIPLAPEISSQPSDRTVNEGGSASFTVSASGGALTYQWRKGGVNLADGGRISGATTANLVISDTDPSDEGTYDVIVSNIGGSVTSSGAALTVNDRTELANQTVVIGAPSSFTATGPSGSTFQWQRDGVDITGATSATYTIPNTTNLQTGSYTVRVTSSAGTLNSNPATLAVSPATQRSVWIMDGSAYASATDLGSFDSNWKIVSLVSLNGDDKPDVLWENISTGERYIWLMDGFNHFGDVDLGVVGPNWSIVAATDYDGDGQADFIWQNRATGEGWVWLMSGTTQTGAVDIGSAPAEDYIVAVADFNGDRNADLVWENRETGEHWIALMVNGTSTATWALDTTSLDWSLAAAADYNHDGHPDIYWQNKVTGERMISLMNGGTVTADVDLGIIDPQWDIATVTDMNRDGKQDIVWEVRPVRTIGSDFNRDGMPDVLWQNSATGERYMWLLHETDHWGDAPLATRTTDWQIAASGDFNLDGRPDFLWQNTTTGQREIRYMEGWTEVGQHDLGVLSPDWKMVSAADFNADGRADILWQNTTTGSLYLWVMDEDNHYGDYDYGILPVAEKVVGVADFDGDGFNDVLWQNTSTGNCHLWMMNKTTFVSDEPVGTAAASEQVASVADYDRDGHPDILWSNTSTGNRHFWLMNGTTKREDVNLATLSTDWKIVP